VISTTKYQVTSASNAQEHSKIIHCGITYTLSFASRSSMTMHANLPLLVCILSQINPLHITAEHPNNVWWNYELCNSLPCRFLCPHCIFSLMTKYSLRHSVLTIRTWIYDNNFSLC